MPNEVHRDGAYPAGTGALVSTSPDSQRPVAARGADRILGGARHLADMRGLVTRRSEQDPTSRQEKRGKDSNNIDGILASVRANTSVVTIVHREEDPERPGFGGQVYVTLSDPLIPQSKKDLRPYREEPQTQQDNSAGTNADLVTSSGNAEIHPTFGSDPDRVPFKYPAGAHGKSVSKEEVKNRLSKHRYWARIELNLVPNYNPQMDNHQDEPSQGISLKDEILSAFDSPFAILTSSRQMTPGEIDERINKAEDEHDVAVGRERSAKEQNKAQQQLHLQALLDEGKRTGMFETTLVIGADSETELEHLCGTLEALLKQNRAVETKVHLQDESVEDSAIHVYTNVDDALAAQSRVKKNKNGISREVLRRLIPQRPEEELRGIEIEYREPHQLNIPGAKDPLKFPPEHNMHIGLIEDEHGIQGEPIILNSNTTEKGALVVGRTGSGKTKLMEQYLIQYVRTASRFGNERKPAIYVDPKQLQPGEQEVAQDLANALAVDGITVNKVKIGSLNDIAVGLNPLDPGSATLDEAYARKLSAILTKSFGMGDSNVDGLATETIGRFMDKAILGDRDFKGIYERYGWDLKTGEPLIHGSTPKIPTMYDLIDIIEEAALAQEYGQGTEAANVVAWLKSIQMRKATGLAQTFYEGEPIDINKLFEVSINEETGQPTAAVTVIDISDAEEGEQALIMGLIAMRVEDYLHNIENNEDELHNSENKQVWQAKEVLLAMDEANRLLSGEGDLAERLAKITETIRGSHGSLLYGAQSPHLISSRILGQIEHKFGMQLQHEENLKSFQGLTSMTDAQVAELPTYKQGEVVYQGAGMQTVRGRVHDLSPAIYREDQRYNAHIGKPENLTREGAGEFRFTTKRKIELDRLFNKEEEGRALTLLAMTVTLNRLFGMDTQVGLNEEYMQQKGYTLFDQVRVLDDNEQAYLVAKAATLMVTAQSEYFHQLAKRLTPEAKALLIPYVEEKEEGRTFANEQARKAFRLKILLAYPDMDALTLANGGRRIGKDTPDVLYEPNYKSLDDVIERVRTEMMNALSPEVEPNETYDNEFAVTGYMTEAGVLLTQYILDAEEGKTFKNEKERRQFQVDLPPYPNVEELTRANGGKEVKVIKDGKELGAFDQLNSLKYKAMTNILLANNPLRDGTFMDRIVGKTLAKAIKEGQEGGWKETYDFILECINSREESTAFLFDQVDKAIEQKKIEIRSSQQAGVAALVEQIKMLVQQIKGDGSNDQLVSTLAKIADQQHQIMLGMHNQGGRLADGPIVDVPVQPVKEASGGTLVNFDKERVVEYLKGLNEAKTAQLVDAMTSRELQRRQFESTVYGTDFDSTQPHTIIIQKSRIYVMLKTLQQVDIDFSKIAEACVPRTFAEKWAKSAEDPEDVDVDEVLQVFRGSLANQLNRDKENGAFDVTYQACEPMLLAAFNLAMSPDETLLTVYSDSEFMTKVNRKMYGHALHYVREQQNFDKYLGSSEELAQSFLATTTGERLHGETAIQRALDVSRILTSAWVKETWGDEAERLPVDLRNWLKGPERSIVTQVGTQIDPEELLEASIRLRGFAEQDTMDTFANQILEQLGNTKRSPKENIEKIVELYGKFMAIDQDFKFAVVTQEDPGIQERDRAKLLRLNDYLENQSVDSPRFRGVRDRLAIERAILMARLTIKDEDYSQADHILSGLKKACKSINEFLESTSYIDQAISNRIAYMQAFYSETASMLTQYEFDAYESDAEVEVKSEPGKDIDPVLQKRNVGILNMQRDAGKIARREKIE